jgi:predicted nucleotidyltransferase
VTEPTVVYETVHGSHAYGLAREGSDLDLKGVVVGPARWYLGFGAAPEQLELGPDHVRYDVRKLFRLLVACNPTVTEMLWTDPADHRTVTPAGARLLATRSSFLSKRARDTFDGYALAQLRRIRSHRRWLLSPPAGAPRRADFGLPDKRAVPRAELGAAEAVLARDDGSVEASLAPGFLDLLAREKRWRAAEREWQQYETWRRERNPARAALEAKHGYDTKHAMHLVRLQRMAIEILETSHVTVKRPDRDELLAIRDGAWSYERLIEESERLSARSTEAAARSTLPDAPDEVSLDALCVSITREVLP